jgi:hypothetical protein
MCKKGAAHVQAVGRVAVQQPGRQAVADNADPGQDDHDQGRRPPGAQKARSGMIKNNPGSPGQQHDIDQGGQDFSAPVAEGIEHRGAPAADAKRDVGNQQGREIAEIMYGIRNQGHAVGQQPADDLGRGNHQVQRQRNQQPGTGGIRQVRTVMGPCMTAAVPDSCLRAVGSRLTHSGRSRFPLSFFPPSLYSPPSVGNPACRQTLQPLTSTRTSSKPMSLRKRANSWLNSQLSPSQ